MVAEDALKCLTSKKVGAAGWQKKLDERSRRLDVDEDATAQKPRAKWSREALRIKSAVARWQSWRGMDMANERARAKEKEKEKGRASRRSLVCARSYEHSPYAHMQNCRGATFYPVCRCASSCELSIRRRATLTVLVVLTATRTCKFPNLSFLYTQKNDRLFLSQYLFSPLAFFPNC